MTLGEQEVERGFEHLRTIALLHYDKPIPEVIEALNLVLEGLGLDESGRDKLIERTRQLASDPAAASWIVLGVIAALTAVQHGAESD